MDRFLYAPTYISTLSGIAAAGDMYGAVATQAGIALAANKALYIPFYLPVPYPVRRLFWCNATGTTATNVDVGIYTKDGTLLASTGGVAKGATSSAIYYTLPTEMLLMPGHYYLAYVNNSGGASIANGSSVSLYENRAGGVLEQDTAYPLPAAMTPVTVTVAVYPHFGFTQTP